MKPVLFNTEDVNAVLDGRKTTMRRVCNITASGRKVLHNRCVTSVYPAIDMYGTCVQFYNEHNTYQGAATAYCQPGDILYVQKTWCQPAKHTFWYRSDSPVQNILWHPSIHMPKEAAKIFLRVKDVRVERLQDITEQEAINEGIRIGMGGKPYFSCKDAFAHTWGHNWKVNPWVWVIEFERIEKEEAEKCDR